MIMKNDHRKECQQRLSVVHRGPNHTAREKQLDQRNEMKDQPQAGGVQRNAAEKIAGTGERKERIDQPDEITSQREAQPKQCHRLGKYQSPLSLMHGGISYT